MSNKFKFHNYLDSAGDKVFYPRSRVFRYFKSHFLDEYDNEKQFHKNKKMGVTKPIAFWLFASAVNLCDKVGQETLDAQDIKLDDILKLEGVDREDFEDVLIEFFDKFFSNNDSKKRNIIECPECHEHRNEILSTRIGSKTWEKFYEVFDNLKLLAPNWKALKDNSEGNNSAGPVILPYSDEKESGLHSVSDTGGYMTVRMAQQGIREFFKFFDGYSSLEAKKQKKPCKEHIYPANTSAAIVMDKINSDEEYNIIDFIIDYTTEYGRVFKVTSDQNTALTEYGGQSMADWEDYRHFHPLVAYVMIRLRVLDEDGNQPPVDRLDFLNSVDYFKLADREDFKVYDGEVAIYKPSFRFTLPEVYFGQEDTKVANNIINFITAIEDNFEYDPYNKMVGEDIYEVYEEYLGEFAVSESLFYYMLNLYTGSGELLSNTSIQRVNQKGLENGRSGYGGLRLREDSMVDLEKDRDIHFEYKSDRKERVDYSLKMEKIVVPRIKEKLDKTDNKLFSTESLNRVAGHTCKTLLGKIISEHREDLGVEKGRVGSLRGWQKVD